MTLPTQLQDALRSLSPLEAVAVVTGIAYVLLIMRRNRWGWVAGAISSTSKSEARPSSTGRR